MLGGSGVSDTDVQEWEALCLLSTDLEHSLSPAVCLVLALIQLHIIATTFAALRRQFQVVAGLENDRAIVALGAGIVVGHGVLAVVGDILVRLGTEQLQEDELYAVNLVGELESTIGFITEPGGLH